MADSKIRVTPQILKDQAEKMKSISEQIYSINNAATAAMDKIGFSLFTTYSIILESKCKKVLKNIGTVRESMELGCDVALTCANRYENTDKVIRDKIGDLPEEVLGTPVSEQVVSMPIEEKIMHRMEKLKQSKQEIFGQGRPWGDVYKKDYNGVSGVDASQCMAMAIMMQIEAYGLTEGNWRSMRERTQVDINSIQPGDVLQYNRNPKAGLGSGVHVVFVIDVNKDETGNVISLSIGEGNAYDGERYGVVNYREMPISDIIKDTTYVSRLKDKYIPLDMKK